MFYFYQFPVALFSPITQNWPFYKPHRIPRVLLPMLFIFNLTFWFFWRASDRYVTALSQEIFFFSSSNCSRREVPAITNWTEKAFHFSRLHKSLKYLAKNASPIFRFSIYWVADWLNASVIKQLIGGYFNFNFMLNIHWRYNVYGNWLSLRAKQH